MVVIFCDQPKMVTGGKAIVLTDDYPQREYKSIKDIQSNLHWGQRKLLLSEIDFLINRPNLVVYAGAANGHHIGILLDMFPNEFHLYDPSPFNSSLLGKVFTDEVAKHYINKDIIFISDIRSYSDIDDIMEKHVIKNMLDQQRWVEIMKPVASMLKFRLPYPRDNVPEDFEYLNDEIKFQCWAPRQD